jgi:hypothetical protein
MGACWYSAADAAPAITITAITTTVITTMR